MGLGARARLTRIKPSHAKVAKNEWPRLTRDITAMDNTTPADHARLRAWPARRAGIGRCTGSARSLQSG
jgi:hypothetical protein